MQRARLTKGEKAPFTGTLLNDAAVAKITTAYEKTIAKLELDLAALQRELMLLKRANEAVCKAKVDGEQAKRQACLDDKERQRKLFFDTIEQRKCPSQVWNYLTFIGGAVVGGGICVLADRVK